MFHPAVICIKITIFSYYQAAYKIIMSAAIPNIFRRNLSLIEGYQYWYIGIHSCFLMLISKTTELSWVVVYLCESAIWEFKKFI